MQENNIPKVLLVSPTPPPIGGIATWSIDFLNYYSDKQDNWKIIHQNSASKYRKVTNLGTWHRLTTGFKDTYELLAEFRKNIDLLRPDVIQITSSPSLAFIKDIMLLYFARKRKIPVITHFHFGTVPAIIQRRNWEWRLLCKVLLWSKMVIVLDQKSHNSLLNAGFGNVVNISNPISLDLEEIAKRRQMASNQANNNRILFIGHVELEKGVFELVEACNSLPEIKELVIIGPYNENTKDKLIRLSRKRENGNWLKFLGPLSNSEVLDQLSNASLMALPSYTEGFPIVVVEAMAMGCPVVATNVGAIPEMLDIKSENPCGICVNPKNVEELSFALNSLITDSELAKKMGRNGNQKVLNSYTFSNLSRLYEMTWTKALTDNWVL